ncbi:hypothetical protein JQ581_29870 [Bradyrhizobium liaoningense]|uniref:hypothetical protein n=1 Tax=Bradyrhizobium liaoningense TaxID=43992 RepID=UPI001BA5DD26|nr:hypothetical protein [Bradyrhizobium liaoningense]MBR0741147.1 hypothetical protein [Bradyrhizobium liaoningense]
MSILIANSLILTHPFKFGFGFDCILALALQIKKQSLLLSEPSFSFDYIALDPPQLVKYCSLIHYNFDATVLSECLSAERSYQHCFQLNQLLECSGRLPSFPKD